MIVPMTNDNQPSGPAANSQPAEGRIAINLICGADGISSVQLASTRPLNLMRLTIGRSAAEPPALMPLIFNICGMAQAAASVGAIEDACGRADSGSKAARDLIVLAETMREHVLRVGLDWPRFLGETPSAEDVEGVRTITALPRKMSMALFGAAAPFALGARANPDRAAASGLIVEAAAALERSIFGMAADVWLEACADCDALRRWAEGKATVAARLIALVYSRNWQRAGAIEPRFLPALGRQALITRLFSADGESFSAAPNWEGCPCETGPLAREAASPLVMAVTAEFGAGLMARLTARLVELASLPARMLSLLDGIATPAAPALPIAEASDGFGIAQVEAARGRLIHAVDLRGARVAAYRIVAPTEWNFHPQGAAATALARLGTASPAEMKQLAELLVHAIDPCVAYDIALT